VVEEKVGNGDALLEEDESGEEKSQLSLDVATDQMSFIISGPKRFVLRGDTDRQKSANQ